MGRRLFWLAAVMACLVSSVCTIRADEGMWLFNALPVRYLSNKYNFEPTEEWARKVQLASVRFNVGGSASFISSNGLVLTNHHVGSDTLYKLSTRERDIYRDGFLARTFEEELKAPDLELNQLVKIVDVTQFVNKEVDSKMLPKDAAAARRSAIAKIEEQAQKVNGNRCDVVTLYGGGRYHLYEYKKYTDVRLVWSPESSAAFFGGDADNFEYPRYCLDACIFRVYEDGKPAKIDHFFKWSNNGPQENELVFVSGNPGSTSRIYTVAALKYQRDVYLPYVMDFIRRREVLLQQFGLEGEEQARIAKEMLSGFQNARKARQGMLRGLQDPAVMAKKMAAEAKLLRAMNTEPDTKSYVTAWKKIEDVLNKRAEMLGQGVNLNERLFNIAQQLVQLAEEDQKPSGLRLPAYEDSNRDSLMQQLLSEAPIYKELEQVVLGDLIARMCEVMGAEHPLCTKILDGKSPLDRAAQLIGETQLDDVKVRKALAEGGIDAIKNSKDPLILLAQAVDPEVRARQKITDELDEIERQAYAKISDAIFRTQGTSTYPDATFTLRLSFGPVRGYQEKGFQVKPFTQFSGAFDHEKAHDGQADFALPESFHAAIDKMNPNTPFNFVCTADIIGGNSGSPVFNKDLELVGLIFDGNIQSLTGDYLYSDRQSRSVSVHSSMIRDAIRYIYNAEALADQLGK